MRIKPEQLATQLGQRGLSRVTLVSGDEPLQKRDAVDAIRKYARAQGVDERVTFDTVIGVDWPELLLALQSMSLFASRRLFEIDIHAGKLGKDGGAALIEVVEAIGGGDSLLLIADKLDRTTQATRWFKAIEAAGVIVQVWPVALAQIAPWLQQRVARSGVRLSIEAAEFIAARVEGNMLAAAQELEKLALLVPGPTINLQDVVAAVVDSTRYDVFGTVDEALGGHAARAVRMLRGLHEEGIEPILLSWAVHREIRASAGMRAALDAGSSLEDVLAQQRVWDNRRGSVTAALRRHSSAAWHALLRGSARIDAIVKGAEPGDAWRELEWLLLQVARAQ